jgi:hypothetical protein
MMDRIATPFTEGSVGDAPYLLPAGGAWLADQLIAHGFVTPGPYVAAAGIRSPPS